MTFRLRLACLVAVCLILPSNAVAHYCSNIFSGPARFVVKPEKTTVYVNGATKLRVYLQSNWPYKMFGVQMRMSGLPSGYSSTVLPASRDIYPGQNVAYDFTISGPTGNVTVTATLQVLFRVGSWRGPTDRLVSQTPTQATLTSSGYYGAGAAEQSPSLNLAALYDIYPSATLPAGTPTFGHNGITQLIRMFGYRYCWDEGGSYACATASDCPSPCAEQTWSNPNDIDTFAQDCMRAGVEIAVRKNKLGSDLQAARDGAVNALKGAGSIQHKCLAAVIGGYLWQGAADATPFTSVLAASANGVSTICQAAGQRALNGSNSSSCGSGAYAERAACAAAEGLNNNDTPVTSLLMPNSGDGSSCSGSDWHSCLYYAYMLTIVQGYRKASGGSVPFYPDAGGPLNGDAPVVTPDTKPPLDLPKTDLPKTDLPKTPDQAKPADLPKPVDAKKDTVKPPDQKKPDAVTKKDGPVKKDGPKAPDSKPSDALAIDGVQPTETAPTSDAVTPTETGVQVEQGVKKEAGTNNQNKLDGGCGCAVAEAQSGAPALLVIALFTLVLCIRRRKR
jgi:MYXO-CTERM domain-containing protein